ncbi:nucleoside-diphosphate kinase [Candidatus Nomurabacteria bacterium]|nr:nucleoside-diphosphate kinase [Candidatus Nomurabacteria bacterium]
MKQRSYVMIKTDGVQRSLVGEIIKRFEQSSLKLVGIKMFVPDRKRATEHYGKDDQWCEKKGANTIKNLEAAGLPIEKSALEYGREIVDQLLNYITAGPVVAMVWEGHEAVNVVKKLVGETQPTTSDVGTIRGDYTVDSYELANLQQRAVRNLIHCTGEPEESDFEVNLWFTPEELIEYAHISEIMLYDVNIDGIFE